MLVSVILATYNDEKHIKEAIDSILEQTHKEFEFIIIDDGSTDSTKEIIKSYNDDRIILLENKKNMGLPYSLNRGLTIAKGKYVARMDGDDICYKERLEKQLQYMEEHPDITICGANRLQFGSGKSKKMYFPEKCEQLRVRLLFGSPIAHPSWFIRKSDFDKFDFKYNEEFRYSQDYELISRVLKKCKIACVPDVLIKYRGIVNKPKHVHEKGIRYTISVLRRILRDLHMNLERPDMDLLIGYDVDFSKAENVYRLVSLYRKIIAQNKKYQVFQHDALIKTLKRTLCIKCKSKIWLLLLCWDVITPYEVIAFRTDKRNYSPNETYYY